MNCDICGNPTKRKTSHMGQDRFVCPRCGLHMIDVEDINPNADSYDKLLSSVHSVREINYNRIIKSIISESSHKDICGLEIGCASGDFMLLAEEKGINMIGIEPMLNSYKIAIERGLKVIHGFFPDDMEKNHKKVDFIIFNDVFEHISDGKKVLNECRNYLKKSGQIIINLPMTTGVTYKLGCLFDFFGLGFLLRRLYQLDTDSPHLYYYNKKSINWIANTTGYKLIRHSQRMKSITFSSIKERIDAVPMDISKFGKVFLRLSCCIFFPIFSLLPADVRAYYYSS